MERLRRPVHRHDGAGLHEVAKEIAQIRRKACSVRRAAGLMVFLTALAATCFSYPAILLENFPYHAPPLVLNLIFALGVGSLISLLAFAGLGMIYRSKLRNREEVIRHRAASLSAPPSGAPDAASLPEGTA